MITSRHSVQAYFYGKPEFIGAKVLFINVMKGCLRTGRT